MIVHSDKRPCRKCRQQRRKCVWQPNSQACERCDRLGRECIPNRDHDPDSDLEYDQDQLLDGAMEVQMLERQIEELQLDLDSMTKIMTQDKQHGQEHSAQSNQALEKPPYQWDLTVVNGQLRLHSEIKSMEELLAYGQALFTYLSPFSGVFQNTTLFFGGVEDSTNMIHNTHNLFRKGGHMRPSVRPVPTITSTLESGFKSTVDLLIKIYFDCFNRIIPMLHKPAFLEYYSKLKDVRTCSITMAVCATICTTTCRHLPFASHQEARAAADYFYSLSHQRVLDIFDDPEYRLVTLISLNMSVSYLHSVLRLSESIKNTTMGLLIAQDLKSVYEDPNQPLLERVLFNRHYMYNKATNAYISSMLMGKNMNHFGELPKIMSMPDELPATAKFLEIFNHIIDITHVPYVIYVFEQLQHIQFGRTGKMSFEVVLRFEQSIVEWWRSLPDDLRICQDPLDESCLNLIVEASHREEFKEEFKVFTLVIFHMIWLHANLCFLRPLKKLSGLANDELVWIIQSRAETSLLLSAKVLAAAAQLLQIDEVYCHFTEQLLFESMETLTSLFTITTKPHIASQAQQLLAKYLGFIDQNPSLNANRVPQSISPLRTSDMDENTMSLYQVYPNPRLAMMYDIIKTSLWKSNLLDGPTDSIFSPSNYSSSSSSSSPYW